MVDISASQIKTWRLCNAKWGYDKIDNVPRGKDKLKTAFGKEVHKHLELFGRDGVPIPYTKSGKIARAALTKKGFVPAFHSGMMYEHEFKFDVPDVPGVRLLGLEDVVDGNTVYDYKTTSGYRYIPSEEEWRQSPQVVIYGVEAMLRAGTPKCRVEFLYMVLAWKQDGSVKLSGTTKRAGDFVVADFRKPWEVLCENMQEIRDARRTVKAAKDLPREPSACSAFGGCEYRGICPVSPLDRVSTLIAIGGK